MVKPEFNIPSKLLHDINKFVNEADPQYFHELSFSTHRTPCHLDQHDIQITKDVKEFSRSCFKQLDVDLIEEPILGNFIGVVEEGGYVHQHMDPRTDGKCHVRINFMISKPDIGGMPIINGRTYDIKEGECWINLASEWEHGTDIVKGTKPRITLSIGSLVDYADLHKVTSILNTGV